MQRASDAYDNESMALILFSYAHRFADALGVSQIIAEYKARMALDEAAAA